MTGLFYRRGGCGPRTVFCPPAPRGATGWPTRPAFSGSWPTRPRQWLPVDWLRRLKHFRPGCASTSWGPRVELDRLDMEMFWDVVWRLFFSPTLSAAEDLPLVANGKFLLANFSDGMFQVANLVEAPAASSSTRASYDFLIVQDPRPLRDRSGTRQIVRYHDLIPLVRPDTMRNTWYIKWHHRAIRQQTESHGCSFATRSRRARI